MSLFDRKRTGLAGLVLAGLLLAGCSVTPVHTGVSGANAVNLTYAEPLTRLEQIFYRHMSAGLGSDSVADDGQLSARIRVSSSRIGLANVSSLVTDHQITATVGYSVNKDGQTIATGSRTATANYQTTSQIVGDDVARASAEEQAVRAAAEQIKLALFAELSNR